LEALEPMAASRCSAVDSGFDPGTFAESGLVLGPGGCQTRNEVGNEDRIKPEPARPIT